MLSNLFKKKKVSRTLRIEASGDSPFGPITLGNAQHQGKRNYQEDSFGFSETSTEAYASKGILAVLADGMGGLKNGKAVSSTTVSSLLDWFNKKQNTITSGTDLMNATVEINKAICAAYCSDGKISSGTTIVAALIKSGYLHWLCVGDSRLYIKRGKELHQVNEDHDYLNQLLDSVIEGNMRAEDAFDDRQKDSLAACIGKSDLECFDYSKRGYPLEKGDVIVLCSDGIYNAVTEKEICQYITDDAMDSCNRIIKAVAAKRISNQDNNTIIIMNYN